jgi:hypothetical protein
MIGGLNDRVLNGSSMLKLKNWLILYKKKTVFFRKFNFSISCMMIDFDQFLGNLFLVFINI